MLRAAPQAPAQNAQLRRLSGAGAARTLASGGGGRRGVLAAHPPSQAVGTQHPPIQLKAERLTPEAFAPFGQVIQAGEDGAVYGPDDAQLVLNKGTPRFYIMRLKSRGLKFDRITHHKQVTQCLSGVGETPWYMAVATPPSRPNQADLKAFEIPPGVAVKLNEGTWHAGPFFVGREEMGFYNLELSDTNVTDHTNHYFNNEGLSFEILPPQ